MEIEIGKTYKSDLPPFTSRELKITGYINRSYSYDIVKGNPLFGFAQVFTDDSDLAKSLSLVPVLPHICEMIVSGEPLEVGELFTVTGFAYNPYHIDEYGRIIRNDGEPMDRSGILDMINNSDMYPITRTPQFSEDEKAFMRELAKAGFPKFYRCAYDELIITKEDGTGRITLPNSILTQIIKENSPFNSASYLEGLK